MPESAREELQSLLTGCQSLVLATLDESGAPAPSYAPFVRDRSGAFFVFVSGLADHTRNMGRDDRVGVMLIDDESDSRQIFARRRLMLDCRSEAIGPDSPEYESRLDAMEQRFGEVVGMLRGLPDFVLFRLVPVSGRFVLGFGQAYAVEGPAMELSGPLGPNSNG